MARGWQGVVLRALGAKDHLLTVEGSEMLAPAFARIHLRAPTLFGQVDPAPASWLRFWFPDPDGGRREYQRAYTIAQADADAGRLDVDFVLHEPAGPASAWAATARPGDRIVAQSLGSTPFEPAAETEGLVLLGDPASLPAVNGILGSLPAERPIILLLELGHEHDAQIPVTGHPGLRIHHVPRAGPDSLVAAVAERDVPLDGWQVWAAGETSSLKALRTTVRNRAGATKANTHVQAYWIEGRAMGTAREQPSAE